MEQKKSVKIKYKQLYTEEKKKTQELEYILKNKDKSEKSLEEIINEIPESIMRTILKIYKNKYDKDTSIDISVKDILNNIFDQLYYYEDMISKELIDNMKLHYVNYYELLIIKILPLLLVNCENILKFFIVLNRLNKIKKILEPYKDEKILEFYKDKKKK